MNIEGMNVVVTGGAGFIGSHLVDALVARGCRVLVVDDFSSGSRQNLRQHEGNPAVRVAQADIRDEGALARLFAGARIVFHLACRNVRLSLAQPTVVHEVNATGTLNVLKAASGAGVRRLLYTSSSEVNGTADVVPMPEDYHFRPETIYGASKLTGEYYAQVFHRAGWLETVVARPHNSYGPREHYDGVKGEVIPRFILRGLAGLPPVIYGSGEQTRDFTYVTETAETLVALAEADQAAGGTFNVCRGEEVSVRRLAELVLEALDLRLEPEFRPGRPSDVLRLFGDPSRLRALLGRGPSVGIREGLGRTIAWFRENVRLDGPLLDSLAGNNWEIRAGEPWLERRRAPAAPSAGPTPLPLARPELGWAEAQAAGEAVLSGWVTQGPRVASFEEAFALKVGARHACAVSSCTAALHLALLGVGVRPGDVVLTVSHSFIATANAVRHCGAEPWFVDIDPATGNMDPAALRLALENRFEPRHGALRLAGAEALSWTGTPLELLAGPLGRLGAILVVHQVGMPADMGAILALAKAHGVPVVEDAACAIGSALRPGPEAPWEAVGRPHGDVACFSFHPRKVLTTGDGGMITTNDPGLDARLRLLRQHGMDLSDLARHGSATVALERYLITGWNYRLTDIQAAVGLRQLERLDEIVARRRELAGEYLRLLKSCRGLALPAEPAHGRGNWQSFVVRLAEPERREAVMQRLLDQGIATRRGIMCAHLEPPYLGTPSGRGLPGSELASQSGLILPLFGAMTEAQCARVAETLVEALSA